MNTPTNSQNDQATAWNGPSGHAWADMQPSLDRLFRPFEDLLVKAVSARAPRRVLDVGCGAGATTLALARGLGATCQCTGVDISEPLLATARHRAAHENLSVDFLRADAGTHAFPPAGFDMIVSRFGVMFFDDPVAAFSNLRRAATPMAALRVLVWRSAADNPFMTTAERAAAPLLPNLPPRLLGAPGQFAFSDPQHVHNILTASGWTAIEIQPVDVLCGFPETDLVPYFTRLGPVGLALQETSEPLRTEVVATVRAAFEPFIHGSEVHFTAACWWVTAEAVPQTAQAKQSA